MDKFFYMPPGYGKYYANLLYLNSIANKLDDQQLLRLIWINANEIDKSYSIPHIENQIKTIQRLINIQKKRDKIHK